ncbi:MAG: FKBP-type peptidyl-prolyl cis-trans isomerase [Flavobacteriaceae bacterium]
MKKFVPLCVLFFVIFISCKKEDEVEPPRDISEQSLADDQSLRDFLSNHFYNYEDFSNPDSYSQITIDSISGENSGKIPLVDQVEKNVVRVKTSDGSFVDHTLYYLIAREGEGRNPSSVDSTFVSYEGMLLNGNTFDQSKEPIWFDLTQVVRGFREGVPALKGGTYEVSEDNTVTFKNYGQGVLFFPSGLGYFSNNSGPIPAYSPLIFKINLYIVKQTDHDGDGILSADEFDNDGDGIGDDTDGDGIMDYLDPDS